MLQRLNIYPSPLIGRGIARLSRLFAMLAIFAGIPALPVFAATPTTTTLAVSSPTITAEHPVTLVATVRANGNAVNPGQVVFCNASAPYCEDLAILGTAQLTSNGTATIKTLLPSGTHGIYAKFLGTKGTTSYAPSSSALTPKTVNVTGGLQPVEADIFTTGSAGNRTLTATINVGAAPATGAVSFLDANSYRQIASASLVPSTSRFGLAPSQEYLTGDSLGYVAPIIGDFNNDGIPDMIHPVLLDPPNDGSNGYPTAISVLPGDPSHPGHLLAQVNTEAIGQSPEGFAVADFNGDGILDIVLTDLGTGAVIVSLGDAAHPGQFLPAQTYPSGNQYYDGGVIQADFNGDGLPDLAVINYPDYSNLGTVNLLMNDPAHPGQFLAPQAFTASQPANTFVAADFNGDGTIDLAAISNSSATPARGELIVFPGDPANPGKFLAAITSDAGPYSVYGGAVADFNGDGVPDLLLSASSSGPEPEIGLALGDKAHPGKFLEPVFYLIPVNSPVGLDLGDFNADGVLDLAYTYFDQTVEPPVSGVSLFYGDPAHPGQFLPGPTRSFGPEVNAIVAGDLNGDGLADVAYTGSDNNGAYVQVQLGQRTETATAYHFNSGTTSFASAFYPGDSNYGYVASCEIPLDAKAAYPTILNPTVSNVTGTSATISWTSNVPTYGLVQYVIEYPPSPTEPSFVTESTKWDPSESTAHSFVLSNLMPGMQYEYTIYTQAYFSGCDHYTASKLGFLTTANQ